MSGSTDGGVDASIPLQAGKGVTQNPLASSSPAQILNVLNTLNQLKLFPGQLQQQQLGIQQSQTQLQGSQLALLQNKVNVFNGAMSPLIRLGANVTPKDVYSTVAGLHAAGFPTDEFVADMATRCRCWRPRTPLILRPARHTASSCKVGFSITPRGHGILARKPRRSGRISTWSIPAVTSGRLTRMHTPIPELPACHRLAGR